MGRRNMNLGELVVNLTADASSLQTGLNSASDMVSNFVAKTSDSVLGFGNKMNAALGTALTVGLGATAAGLTALGGGIGYVTNQAAGFEQRMSNLQAVSLASNEEMQKLTETAMKLGATTVFSANDVADAMYYLSSAGFSVEENIGTIPAVLDLAAASQADLATTSNILANILSGFGASVADAAHYADVLALASAKSNTDVVMLGEGMKYVAPVAGALGFTIEETVAAMGKLSDAGIASSQAGTTLRTILASLAAPTGKTVDAIADLNLELQDADGTMKSLPDIIAEMQEGMAGMTDTEKAMYANWIAGQEGMSGLLVLLNEGEAAISDYADELETADGVAQQMAETQLDNLSGSFENMSGAADGFVLTMGNAFLPIIRDGIDAITEFIGDTLQPLAEQFNQWLPNAIEDTNAVFDGFMYYVKSGDISDFNTGIALLAENFGLSSEEADNLAISITTTYENIENFVNTVVDFVENHAEGFKGALIGIGTAIAGMMVIAAVSGAIATLVNPVTAIIALAGLLGMAWSENWGGIQEKTQAVIDFLTPYVETFVNSIKQFWAENGDAIMTKVSEMWQWVQDAFNAGFPLLIQNAENYMKMLGDAWTWLTVDLPAIVKDVWNKIVGGFNDFVASLQPIVDAFHEAQNGNWYEFGEKLREIVDTIWDNITGAWESFKSNAETVIKNLWENIKTAFTNSGKDINTSVKTTVDDIYKKFNETDWLKVGESVMKLIADGIRSKIASIVAAAQEAAKAALDAINGFLGNGQSSTPTNDDSGTSSGGGVATDSVNTTSINFTSNSSKIQGSNGGAKVVQISMPVSVHTANSELDFYTIFQNIKTELEKESNL